MTEKEVDQLKINIMEKEVDLFDGEQDTLYCNCKDIFWNLLFDKVWKLIEAKRLSLDVMTFSEKEDLKTSVLELVLKNKSGPIPMNENAFISALKVTLTSIE